MQTDSQIIIRKLSGTFAEIYCPHAKPDIAAVLPAAFILVNKRNTEILSKKLNIEIKKLKRRKI